MDEPEDDNFDLRQRQRPARRLSAILLDLASHHERLQQVGRDLSGALSAAETSTGEALRLLRSCNALEEQDPAQSCFTDDFVVRTEDAGSDAGEILAGEFQVPSEWHRRAFASPSHKVSSVKCAALPSEQQDNASRQQTYDEASETNPDMGIIPYTDGYVQDSEMQDMPQPNISFSSSEGSDESWDPSMNIVLHHAVQRMRTRLGKSGLRGSISAFQVFTALTNMGFRAYSPEVIDDLLRDINTAYEQVAQRGWFIRSSTRSSEGQSLPDSNADGNNADNIRFKVFMEAMLNDHILGKLSSERNKMAKTIREVLFSGDANRIIARVMGMSIEDVAMPLEKPSLIERMEPVVVLIVILNGAFIGLQTTATQRTWGDPWFWGNVVFTIFLIMEIIAKLIIGGWTKFTRSSERWWNLFDTTMTVLAVLDVAVELFSPGGDFVPLSIMRILRLTRITRLVKVVRTRFIKELNLMIRGLFGGLQTLFWAIVLLFFTLYIIAILVTTMIGYSDAPQPLDIREDELFSSLPRSFLTSFRCFMGDCTTSTGKPIVKLAADVYGAPFVVGYVASTLFVTFGLFNLIIAVYVENTMHAARTEAVKSVEDSHRDEVRVARLTRQLLKKFCAAERLLGGTLNHVSSRDMRRLNSWKDIGKALRASTIDDVEGLHMEVSRDLYVRVIQDHGVKKLMDDIDIPGERGHLFDILDADSSGGLEVSELVAGLLRVRGEAKKSDAVGTLLAVRATQDMLREQNDRLAGLELQLEKRKWAAGVTETLSRNNRRTLHVRRMSR